MKNFFLFMATGLLLLSCKEEMIQNQVNESENNLFTKEVTKASLYSKGATQISGVGYYAIPVECDAAGQSATYSVKMTGDHVGCLHVFVDEYDCSPSGTYREIGREYFIGTYKGEAGTFWTKYKFEAKFEGCAADGSYLGVEIFGRCQHPIIEGKGTGFFKGVTGRMDFKDDIQAGNFPYRGHFLK